MSTFIQAGRNESQTPDKRHTHLSTNTDGRMVDQTISADNHAKDARAKNIPAGGVFKY
jgi:hypothetical protein